MYTPFAGDAANALWKKGKFGSSLLCDTKIWTNGAMKTITRSGSLRFVLCRTGRGRGLRFRNLFFEYFPEAWSLEVVPHELQPRLGQRILQVNLSGSYLNDVRVLRLKRQSRRIGLGCRRSADRGRWSARANACRSGEPAQVV